MTWKAARLTAIGHIRRLGLPRRLDGMRILLADYESDEALRFLKARAEGESFGLREQRLINQAFGRECRRRGADVRTVVVSVPAYCQWLRQRGLTDDPAMRAKYILNP